MLLSSSCWVVVLQSLGSHQLFSGSCQAIVRQLSCSCQAVIKQSSGRHAVDEKMNQLKKNDLVNRGWGSGQTAILLQGTEGDIPDYSRVWNKRTPLNKRSPLENLAKRIIVAPFLPYTMKSGIRP